MTADPTTPRTAAGRAQHDRWHQTRGNCPRRWGEDCWYADDVEAIEAEAAAPAAPGLDVDAVIWDEHVVAEFLHPFDWSDTPHVLEPGDGSDCHHCYEQADRLLARLLASAPEDTTNG